MALSGLKKVKSKLYYRYQRNKKSIREKFYHKQVLPKQKIIFEDLLIQNLKNQFHFNFVELYVIPVGAVNEKQ